MRRLKHSTLRRYGVLGVRKRVVKDGWVFWPWEGRITAPSGRALRYVPIGVRTPVVARLRQEWFLKTGVRLV